MAGAVNGTITINYALNINNVGPLVPTPSLLIQNGVWGALSPIVANGDNTFDVPAGASTILIVFPSTNTNVKTLKGVGGDTGIGLFPSGTNFLNVPVGSGSTDFIINSTGADTVNTLILFV